MSKKISTGLCINRLNAGKEYIRKWLKEHTDLSDKEIDKQIIK